jgi:hypothetical protein
MKNSSSPSDPHKIAKSFSTSHLSEKPHLYGTLDSHLVKSLSFQEPIWKPNNSYHTLETNKTGGADTGTGGADTGEGRPNLHRTFREIPCHIRERVVDLVMRAEEAADEAKRTQLRMNKELLNLRRDYNHTDKEVSVQQKKRDLYLNQINLNSEKLGALEDDADSRRLRAVKNAEAIARLSRTNKGLVDAFSKLYDDGTGAGAGTGTGDENGDSPDKDSINRMNKRKGSVSPKHRGTFFGGGKDDVTTGQGQGQGDPAAVGAVGVVGGGSNPNPSSTSNEKLRERLLHVAKEHNRVVKNVEVLEIKVEGLRSSVRFADRRNRQLKHELDDLRESASLDGSTVELQANGGAVQVATAGGVSKDEALASKKLKALRAPNTTRLSSLLAAPGFDAMDGIRHLDALLQHIVAAPVTLSEKDVAGHLCNR